MLNLTLSETIRELNYKLQSENDYDSAILLSTIVTALESLQDEKEELEKQAELAEACKDALFALINEKIDLYVASCVDYNENHTDSHDNYAGMVADDYIYTKRQKNLIAFCAENSLDLSCVDIEKLENSLFDNMQSEAVHQFCDRPYYNKFVLACFPFGEHEIQVGFESIGDSVSFEIMNYMKENNLFNACCGSLDNTGGLFYESSSNVLEFYITLESIKTIVADMVADYD